MSRLFDCSCVGEHICGKSNRDEELTTGDSAASYKKYSLIVSGERVLSLKRNGNKQAIIRKDEEGLYDLQLHVCRDGREYGAYIDQELLEMIHEATGDALRMLKEGE